MSEDSPRPPLLFSYGQQPPADAWDLQIGPPPAFHAWLATLPDPDLTGAAIYPVATRHALLTVDEQLPTVPSEAERCERVPWSATAQPHLHVLLAATDAEGRPVTRLDVERAGAAAWVAHAERLVEYTTRRWGIVWTDDGIAGVDDSAVVVNRQCPGAYDLANVVLAVP